jgi:hypothetical protein
MLIYHELHEFARIIGENFVFCGQKRFETSFCFKPLFLSQKNNFLNAKK